MFWWVQPAPMWWNVCVAGCRLWHKPEISQRLGCRWVADTDIKRLNKQTNTTGTNIRGTSLKLLLSMHKESATFCPLFGPAPLENTHWMQTFWWLQFTPARKIYIARPSHSLGYLHSATARQGLILLEFDCVSVIVLNSINNPRKCPAILSFSTCSALNWHAVHFKTS